jgi:hypothetical protein
MKLLILTLLIASTCKGQSGTISDTVKVLILASYEPTLTNTSDVTRQNMLSYPGQLTSAIYGYAVREKQGEGWKEIGYLDSKKKPLKESIIVWNAKVFKWR